MTLLLSSPLAWSGPASAKNYVCHVSVNADRGFTDAFDIEISPDEDQGVVSVKFPRGSKRVGLVQKTVLSKSDSSASGAFNLALQFLGEKDVSGVADITQITEIQRFAVKFDPNVPGLFEEAAIYKFFNGSQQIGGTVFVDGHATACLPK